MYSYIEAEICHFCSASSTLLLHGEVSVHNTIGVQVGQGKSYIVTDIHLVMVRYWIVLSLEL